MLRLFVLLVGVIVSTTCRAQKVVVALPERFQEQTVADIPVLCRALGATSETRWVLTDATGKAVCPDAGKPTEVSVNALGFVPVRDTLSPNETKTISLQASPLETPTVVVTGLGPAQTTEQALYPVQVIDRERIEAQAAVSLQDVLRHQLNMRIQQDNVLGSNLQMLGLSGSRVKILVDNVPVVGRQDGNLDLGQQQLSDIERVEIVEGPMAVAYGTDALGGVINLITRRAPHDDWAAGANFFTETTGHYNVNAYAGFHRGKHGLRLSGGRNFFDGWSPAERERGHQWNPREQFFGNATYELDHQHGFVRVGFRGFDETITNLGGVVEEPFAVYAFDDYYHTRRLDPTLYAEFRVNNWRLSQQVGYNHFRRIKNTYRKNLNTLEQALSANPSDQDTSRFTQWLARGIAAYRKPDSKWQADMGYEVAVAGGEGQRILAGTQTITDIAGFGQVAYQPNARWTFQPGVRWGYNSRFAMPILPAFNVRFRASSAITLRAGYARGFRAPDLKELYLEFVDINHNILGNENLAAETSHYTNVSGTGRWVRGASVWSVGADAYFNTVTNLITLAMVDPETQLFSYVNVGETQTWGGRVSGRWQRERLNLQVGATLNAISNEIEAQNAAPPAFSLSPEAQVIASYRIPKAELLLSAFYKYNGRQPQFLVDADGALIEGHVASFHTLDLTLGRRFWKERILVQAGVRNLANVQNVNAIQSAGAHSSGGGQTAIATGRAYTVQLRFDYH